jgi:para-aminobenzoate synthetase
LKTLIIDNYDSFTFNLFQQIAGIIGQEPLVVPNDRITLQEIKDLNVDAIVLSPGPGSPDQAEDFGVCADILRELDVPLLGVCLGYQGLAHYHGGVVTHAPEPIHGRLSQVQHNESALFKGIPQGFSVVRYHSLAVDTALPDHLEPLAWTKDGILMALQHKVRPFWGIQFHPESICTEFGDQLIQNFFDLAADYHRSQGRPDVAASKAAAKPPHGSQIPARVADNDAGFEVFYRELPFFADPEKAFMRLYADKNDAFWLGSDLVEEALSRFIYIGAAESPHSQVVTYRVKDHKLTVKTPDGIRETSESIFDYLNRELKSRRCTTTDLPFDFNCGFAGYFGYELKAECGSELVHHAPTPDAAFIFCDRLITFDQIDRKTYLVAFASAAEAGECQAWFDDMEAVLADLPEPAAPRPIYNNPGRIQFRLTRPYETYIADIEECFRQINDGESYEICLTNQLHTDPIDNPVDFYRVLRRVNPAPYASYLRFGDIAVLSSSPEQFLHADRQGWVSSKPIKGTIARHPDSAKDEAARNTLGKNEKDSSENLMIVDLLRNDLGRVCDVGSVHVPKLMAVESYATVHQLVSTIRGHLKDDATVVDCLRAAFPGGSMTGAPKIRTLQIIDRLETEARGVYSGSIGFLGLNGTADLNIVIRTAVCTPTDTSIGIGGAIVALSDAQEEFKEILLKARALINAIVYADKGVFGYDHYAVEGVPLKLLKSLPTIPAHYANLTNDQKYREHILKEYEDIGEEHVRYADISPGNR